MQCGFASTARRVGRDAPTPHAAVCLPVPVAHLLSDRRLPPRTTASTSRKAQMAPPCSVAVLALMLEPPDTSREPSVSLTSSTAERRVGSRV